MRAHVLIAGRVQGVGFRSYIKEVADLLNLKGFVRNLSGGRLEAVFEGSEHGVRRALQLCQRGPQGARVERIDANASDSKGEFNSFEIRTEKL